MNRPLRSLLVIAIIAALAPLAASAERSNLLVGKVTTRDKTEMSVSVGQTGSIVLATPSHKIFLDDRLAGALVNSLAAIHEGMKELESKSAGISDFMTIGKLNFGLSSGTSTEGLVFRYELDPSAAEKVSLLMWSTIEKEDIRLSSEAVVTLGDLITRAQRSAGEFSDQIDSLKDVVNKVKVAMAEYN